MNSWTDEISFMESDGPNCMCSTPSTTISSPSTLCYIWNGKLKYVINLCTASTLSAWYWNMDNCIIRSSGVMYIALSWEFFDITNDNTYHPSLQMLSTLNCLSEHIACMVRYRLSHHPEEHLNMFIVLVLNLQPSWWNLCIHLLTLSGHVNTYMESHSKCFQQGTCHRTIVMISVKGQQLIPSIRP